MFYNNSNRISANSKKMLLNKKSLSKILISFLIVLFFSMPAFAERINVAFATDDNYWLYTLLSINSILKNNSSNSDYYFYVLENNLSKKNKLKIMLFTKLHCQHIKFINVDTSIVDGGHNYYKESLEHKYISRIAIARIFLPELLPNIHKVLYLDSDILVTRDLSELYNINLKDYPVAMVGDICMMNQDGSLPKSVNYYNDGIILMNLSYWRRNNITNKMANYMKKKKILPKMDQDLFNIILKNNIMKLDPKWNNQYGYLSKENGIIHYVGRYKPWLENREIDDEYKRYYINLYNEYWDMSPMVIYKYHKRKELYEILYEKIYISTYHNIQHSSKKLCRKY